MPARYPSSPQTLEYLLSAIRVGGPAAAWMRGLKGSRTLLRGRRRRGSKRDRATNVATVFGSRPSVRAVCAIVRPWRSPAIMDLGKRLVIDHGQLRSQARGVAARAADVARMSCTKSSKRPVVHGRCRLAPGSPRYGQLSQSKQQIVRLRDLVTATPLDWQISLHRTRGLHLTETSCNAVPATSLLAPIPGMTRSTTPGPGATFIGSAEVISVLGRCEPACLAAGFAGRSTGRELSSNAGDGGYVGRDRGNNFRQHLHLRRSPWAIASPPARTHHWSTLCRSGL